MEIYHSYFVNNSLTDFDIAANLLDLNLFHHDEEISIGVINKKKDVILNRFV